MALILGGPIIRFQTNFKGGIGWEHCWAHKLIPHLGLLSLGKELLNFPLNPFIQGFGLIPLGLGNLVKNQKPKFAKLPNQKRKGI